MKVTRETLKALRPAIGAALEAVAKQMDCTLRLGNATFDPIAGTFTFKIEGVGSANATGYEKEAGVYKQLHDLLNLPADGIGREFRATGGKTFTVVGMRSGGSNKILAKNDDGKVYLFDHTHVSALFKMADAAKAKAAA